MGPGQASDPAYQRFLAAATAAPTPVQRPEERGGFLGDEAAAAHTVLAVSLPAAGPDREDFEHRYPAAGLDMVPDVDPSRREQLAPAEQRDTDRYVDASIGGVDNQGLQNGAEFDVLASIGGTTRRLKALLDTGARIDFVDTSRVVVPAHALGRAVPMRLTGLGASRNVDTHAVPGATMTVAGDGPELDAPELLALGSALPYDVILGQAFWFRHRANLIYTDDPAMPVAGMSFAGHPGAWLHDLGPGHASAPGDSADAGTADMVAAITEAAAYAGIDLVTTEDLAAENGPAAPNTDGMRVSLELPPGDAADVGAISTDDTAFRLLDAQLPADPRERATIEDMLDPFLRASPKSDDDMPHAEDTPICEAGLHAQRMTIKAAADPDLVPAARPFRIAKDSQLQLDKFLKRMLEKGYIRRSTSAWSSPTFVVPKKGTTTITRENGEEVTVQKIRIVNDFRALNSLTRKDGHGAPNLDQQRDRLEGFAYATSLDLRQSFFQLPLDEHSRKYTGFCTASGSWEYCVVPMGTRNASASFTRMINSLLLPHEAYTASYIDDIVVFSKTFDEHVVHLRAVLQTLVLDNGLSLNLQKCGFALPQITFLGYVLTAAPAGTTGTRCQLDPDLMTAMAQSAPPQSPKEARALLGLANCFAPWIPRFAEIAGPLQCLRGNNLKQCHFKALWAGADGGATMLACFERMRAALSSPPLVMLPCDDKPYTIITDSSQSQIGGMACQPAADGTLLPIGFFSQKLSKHRSTWAICFKELLAVTLCCRRFRSLVGFAHFTVCTDHEPLMCFLGEKPQQNVNWVQARMLDELASFNFSISYLPGRLNIFADYLSRIGRGEPAGVLAADPKDILPGASFGLDNEALAEEDADFPDGAPFAAAVAVDAVDPAGIVAGYAADPLCADILRVLADEGMARHHYYHKCAIGPGGVILLRPHSRALFRTPTILVGTPPGGAEPTARAAASDLKAALIKLFHEAGGHYAAETTLAAVRDFYYWRHMSRDIDSFVAECTTCSLNADAPPGTAGYFQPSEAPSPGSTPWRCVSLDFITGGLEAVEHKGRTCGQLLVMCDQLSRLVKLLPCPVDITAAGVAELYFEEVHPTLGLPAQLKGDRDPKFIADFFQALFAQLGVSVRLSSPYSSASNGLVERTNREVVNHIRRAISRHGSNWARQCCVFEFQMNRRRTRSRDGLSPFQIAYGWVPRAPTDPLQCDLASRAAVAGRTTADAQRAAGIRAGLAITFEADRTAARANKVVRRADIVAGDWVMLAKHAFTPPADRAVPGYKYRGLWNGPFRVTEVTPKGSTLTLDMRDVAPGSRAGDRFNLQHVYRCASPRAVSAEQAGHSSSGPPTAHIEEVLRYIPAGANLPETWMVSWIGKGSQANSRHCLPDFLSPPAQGLAAVHRLLQQFERARTNAAPKFDLRWAYPDGEDWPLGATRLMPDGYLVLKSAGGRLSTLGGVAAAHGVNPCRVLDINSKNPFWARRHKHARPLGVRTHVNSGVLFRLRRVGPAPSPAAGPAGASARIGLRAATATQPEAPSPAVSPTGGSARTEPRAQTAAPPVAQPGWMRVGARVDADDSARSVATGDTGPTGFAAEPQWFPATIIGIACGPPQRIRVHFRDYGSGSKWDISLDVSRVRPANW